MRNASTLASTWRRCSQLGWVTFSALLANRAMSARVRACMICNGRVPVRDAVQVRLSSCWQWKSSIRDCHRLLSDQTSFLVLIFGGRSVSSPLRRPVGELALCWSPRCYGCPPSTGRKWWQKPQGSDTSMTTRRKWISRAEIGLTPNITRFAPRRSGRCWRWASGATKQMHMSAIHGSFTFHWAT